MEIGTVAQVGTGYMGGGIAQSLAAAGFEVRLADADADATGAAHERLLTEAERFEAQGLFPDGSAERIRANLHPTASIKEAVADVDVVADGLRHPGRFLTVHWSNPARSSRAWSSWRGSGPTDR